MLIKLEIIYQLLKFKIKILTIIIAAIQLLGCMPENEIIEVSPGRDYDTTQIALLLPLESQNKNTNALASNLKNAARLAIQDLNYLNLNLTIYPTSGDPKRAAYAAKAAIANDSHIIVGPLFSEETAEVKIALENDNIKIISLSNDPSVAGSGVFIMGTTFKSIANRLVAFAKSEGLHRIAIIGPEGQIGANGILASKNAIISNGSIVSTVSTYPLNINIIGKLASTIYADLVKSNTDAIIFTDSPTRGLGFITQEIYSLFRKNNKKPPQFMGLSRWDSAPSILNEPSLRHGWFIVPDQRFKKQYAARYFKNFGETTKHISSLSYDAIALIGGIINQSGPQTITRMFEQKKFIGNNGFIGVNGIFRFDANGISERSLSVAEVATGNFKIINKAKTKFMEIYDSQ